jgi:hypothetical protein
MTRSLPGPSADRKEKDSETYGDLCNRMTHGAQDIPEHHEYGVITRTVLACQFGRACGRPTKSSQDIRERPRQDPGSVDCAWRNGSGAHASLARRSPPAELERTCGPRRNWQAHFRLAGGRATSRCCVGGLVRTAATSLGGKRRRRRFAGSQNRVEGLRGPMIYKRAIRSTESNDRKRKP